MADIELSRKELVERLACLAFHALKSKGYDLRSVAEFLTGCEKEFAITEEEKIELTVALTEKVISNDVRGRRATDR